jgi:hypothetical protein
VLPSFEFRVIRYEPDARRGERVNIGLLVKTPSGVEVVLLKNMSKALAISPQVSFHVSLQADLTDMYSDFAKHGTLDSAESLGEFTLSKAGNFFCEASELPAQIEAAMKRLVIPARRPSTREGTTRLHTDIKRQFKQNGVLATEPEQIKDHKVVAGFEFPGDEELSADFAFKNGVWTLTQVIDYRSGSAAAAAKKIKEVSLKAISLDQALKDTDRLLGDKLEVVNSAIVWVPDELTEVVAPQIDILGDYAKIFRFQSQREQAQYWAMMNKLTKGFASA